MSRPAVFAFCVFLTSLLVVPRYSTGSEDVSLDVQVVYASSEKTFVDPTLMSLKQKLLRLFNYSSFEIISKMRKYGNRGESTAFAIPGGRSMAIVPVETSGDSVRLDVKIGGGSSSVIKTALRMERGSIVIVGGPGFKNGVLIILISAD